MKENIETKDVQRTEYLNKSGLDMLWAKVKENTHNQVEVERNRAVAKENNIVDTKADKSALDNYVLSTTLAEYAKKTDIPEVDTSDFVIKTTRDIQTIKAPLTVTGILQVNDIDNKPYAFLSATQGFGQLHLFDKATSARSYLEGGSLQINEGSDDGIRITCQGIRNLDDNANHVFATDGSIADLTQYAKKSEISAGGNVDDVQVNGVSVVENKVANIKPATKESLGVVKVGDGLNVTDGTISVDSTAIGAGNYIPYESIDDHIDYKVYITKPNEGILFDSSSDSISISRGEMNIKSATRELSFTSSFIWLQEISDDGNREEILFELNENGLRLRHGDNNHVLTSYGSTIDITQYAKKTELPTVPTKTSELQNDSEFITKSVYDEKIAALEARIAALEAKHTETA